MRDKYSFLYLNTSAITFLNDKHRPHNLPTWKKLQAPLEKITRLARTSGPPPCVLASTAWI